MYPTMQCAEIVDAFQALRVTSRPKPEVPDEGLLVRTLYAGICHSDLHMIDDEMDLGGGQVFRNRDVLGKIYQGLVLGHEICGEVESVGGKVTNDCPFKVGDKVIVYPFRGCGSCENCCGGLSSLCENNLSGTTTIGQGTLPGGYSSHVILPEWQLAVKLPHNIAPEIGCLLPCSALTAYGAILKARPTLEQAVRTRGDANLLIIGTGGLGFWTIILVKSIFCDRNVKVIVADLSQEKLNAATAVGAEDAVLWTAEGNPDDLVATTTMSGYNKIDAAIDYVGLPRTTSIAFRCLHNGGALLVVGLRGGELPLSLPMLIGKSVSIQGIREGTQEKLRELVDLFAVQEITTLPPLEFYKLEDINIALDRLRHGEIKSRALLKYVD